MTVFESRDNEQGDWFSFFTSRYDATTGEIVYDPPEKGAAEFCFRNPAPFWEDQKKGRKRENKMVVNPTSRGMERVSYYVDLSPDEEKKERDDSWDYVITGMRNARWSKDGPEMKCTPENKLKLLKNSTFLRFANRVLTILLETGIKSKEDAEKNSLTPQTGP
ncbi:MAG: hypothetical protein KKD44_29650 [Proteobacteria bacterium]|nr:hypothetical protein [Pseudomonadota bacterium]